MHIRGSAATGVVRIESPTWVPGDYEFVTIGRDVFDLSAVDAVTGASLTVRRSQWQGYEIEGGAGAVDVTYTAYCTSWDRSEACGILSDVNGVLTGARYLRLAGYEGAYEMEYALPDGWAMHHPAGAEQVSDTRWRYPSYEILLDTPVCLGAFDLVTLEVAHTPVSFVFLDRSIGSDSEIERFTTQVVATMRTFHDMFGSFPFPAYTFVCSLNPNAEWGLEHLTSTMVGLGPAVFTDPDQFATGVRVCAHEFFHAWNVRRLRPSTLDRLDFERGSYTEGLWVAEGFTRYYEFLSCTRVGVYTAAQFISSVVNYYRHLTALSAYARVSPNESSRTTFLNHDDKYPGRVNNAIDYYDAGMIIAFGIDATLRIETPDQSLDSAFAGFYRSFVGRGSGYTPTEFCEYLEGIHAGLGHATARQASNPGSLELARHLRAIGIEPVEVSVAYIGLVFLDDGAPTIYGVLDTSPAGESGIAPEDVIIAVEGVPFELAALQSVIAHSATVTVTVLRGNQYRNYTIPVGRRTDVGSLRWVGDDEQARMVASWTGQPFAPEKGGIIPLDFYENFHGIETVV
jgi:predicted metalloprotease with PDZ domain